MAKALSELLEEGVAGRHVLVRSDLNVPLKDGVVTDDGRVRASLPVIEKLAKAGARVIVTAHLGRPKGKVDPQYSIAPAAARLAELASVPVKVATDLVGEDAKAKEVDVLAKTLNDPERPFVVVMGGAKVSDKLAVIDNLIGKADTILIGGGMGYTFAYAQGYEVGQSLLEKDQVENVLRYLKEAPEKGTEIITAVDVVWSDAFSADANTEIRPIEDLTGGKLGAEAEGLDIGPKTREIFAEKIKAAKTIFWNGPVGVFEIAPFAEGTRAVAQAIVDSDAFSIIGGGDSASAVRNLGFKDEQFGHISTGGGASLEYIEGKTLPGLEALGA